MRDAICFFLKHGLQLMEEHGKQQNINISSGFFGDPTVADGEKKTFSEPTKYDRPRDL